jgi:ubiquinone/menaquinone biosynthesis C-methylase UbiE
MPIRSYDNVAPYYDFLSRAIYGNAISKANSYLVNFIPPKSTIAIIGGGTGNILKQIATVHPAGLKIFYIDISAKMISLSKHKRVGENEIIFINSAIQDVTLTEDLDVIITPFFFDNFNNSTAREIFYKINPFLKAAGLWLYADFQDNGGWQRSLLKLMYLFFKMVCNIETSRLPDTKTLFLQAGYTIQQQRSFFSDFIYSMVYRRS